MKFDSMASLKAEGFEGFISVRELMCSCSRVREKRGVYIVIYLGQNMPYFANPGVGGHFEGRDVNAIEGTLREKWVEDTVVVYIGKAGLTREELRESDVAIPGEKKPAKRRPTQLKKRIGAFMRYGKTGKGGHKGGRRIWWIENHKDLTICWKDCESDSRNPREIESEMIQEFKRLHKNKRPFANAVD